MMTSPKKVLEGLVLLVAVLVIGITAAVAMAAPAPKTTGDIGYTAYSAVQRNLTFNAIQSKTDTCSTFWNVTTVSQLTFRLTGEVLVSPDGDYTHHVTLSQAGQSVGGDGGYPVTPPDAYHWNVTAGIINGNALSLTAVYDLGAIGTMNIVGNVASNGSISGTWTDDVGGARSGTFTAPAGSATAIVTYCGKGSAYYSDVAGNSYLVNVKAVSVSGATAWFAGPVVWASNPNWVGQWLFVKVFDGGEPGKLVDSASGSFTDEVTAMNGVILMSDPTDGPFYINSGNLQVHKS